MIISAEDLDQLLEEAMVSIERRQEWGRAIDKALRAAHQLALDDMMDQLRAMRRRARA